MSYKLSFFSGDPMFITDEQGKKIIALWINGQKARVAIENTALDIATISRVEKIDEEPDYPKLDMPPRISEKRKEMIEALDKIRFELGTKLGWEHIYPEKQRAL